MKREEHRRIDDNNRIVIPKRLREAMDLGPGDLLRISLQDNLRTGTEKCPVILLQKAEEE